MTTLGTPELVRLIRTVFAPRPGERDLAVLADLPDEHTPDRPAWAVRRRIAADWAERLAAASVDVGVAATRLVLYRNAGRNNADLPPTAWIHAGGTVPQHVGEIDAEPVPFDDVLASHSIVLAPTELSATAPLKIAARRLGFRAATMPGFAPAMVPALRLDYEEIDRRCRALKSRLDPADEARIRFDADGRPCELTVDLRGQTAVVSSGLVREPGTAGNLPSGETYLVPYEGGRADGPSCTAGHLPVELGHELIVYRIDGNRAIEVEGEGPVAARERDELEAEPAYGNIAELGFGVLHGFGVHPIGEILLDEKLGFHVAFGRSDHFGGRVGPAQFRSAARVVHVDRVYLPELQPRVRVLALDLVVGGVEQPLMRDGAYVGFPW
jgi:hypothetical protein